MKLFVLFWLIIERMYQSVPHKATNQYVEDVLKKLRVTFIQCYFESLVLREFDLQENPDFQT
jgi:hypothetical protein